MTEFNPLKLDLPSGQRLRISEKGELISYKPEETTKKSTWGRFWTWWQNGIELSQVRTKLEDLAQWETKWTTPLSTIKMIKKNIEILNVRIDKHNKNSWLGCIPLVFKVSQFSKKIFDKLIDKETKMDNAIKTLTTDKELSEKVNNYFNLLSPDEIDEFSPFAQNVVEMARCLAKISAESVKYDPETLKTLELSEPVRKLSSDYEKYKNSCKGLLASVDKKVQAKALTHLSWLDLLFKAVDLVFLQARMKGFETFEKEDLLDKAAFTKKIPDAEYHDLEEYTSMSYDEWFKFAYLEPFKAFSKYDPNAAQLTPFQTKIKECEEVLNPKNTNIPPKECQDLNAAVDKLLELSLEDFKKESSLAELKSVFEESDKKQEEMIAGRTEYYKTVYLPCKTTFEKCEKMQKKLIDFDAFYKQFEEKYAAIKWDAEVTLEERESLAALASGISNYSDILDLHSDPKFKKMSETINVLHPLNRLIIALAEFNILTDQVQKSEEKVDEAKIKYILTWQFTLHDQCVLQTPKHTVLTEKLMQPLKNDFVAALKKKGYPFNDYFHPIVKAALEKDPDKFAPLYGHFLQLGDLITQATKEGDVKKTELKELFDELNDKARDIAANIPDAEPICEALDVAFPV